MSKIIKKIRLERLKKGYSQAFIGEKIGIGQRSYGKIERGETKLTITRLQKIANVLSVDIKELIP